MAKLCMGQLFEAAHMMWDDVDNEMLVAHTAKRPTTKVMTEEARRSKPRKDCDGDPLLAAVEIYHDKVYQSHSRKLCGDPLLNEVQRYHEATDASHVCTTPEKDCGDNLFTDAEQYHMVQDMEQAMFHICYKK